MKLMGRVRQMAAEKEYSKNTTRLYLKSIIRYIEYQGVRHPDTMGVAEVKEFLGYLATARFLSGSATNQVINALVFLYRDVLDQPQVAAEIARLRSKTKRNLPETVSKVEIEEVINLLEPKCRLMAFLCYGSGLSVGECVRLKVADVDTGHMVITVRGRETMIPNRAAQMIEEQARIARQWPGNVDGYLFPSSKLHDRRCWFVSESSLQKAMKEAVRRCGLARRVTPKVLRHSFVRHLLQAGYDVRTVQEVAGFRDIKSVMTYQKMNDTQNVISPIDSRKYQEKT